MLAVLFELPLVPEGEVKEANLINNK